MIGSHGSQQTLWLVYLIMTFHFHFVMTVAMNVKTILVCATIATIENIREMYVKFLIGTYEARFLYNARCFDDFRAHIDADISSPLRCHGGANVCHNKTIVRRFCRALTHSQSGNNTFDCVLIRQYSWWIVLHVQVMYYYNSWKWINCQPIKKHNQLRTDKLWSKYRNTTQQNDSIIGI